MLGEPTPHDADPTGSHYAFERRVTKAGGGEGFADVWKRAFFAWEYKGSYRDLRAAYVQLLGSIRSDAGAMVRATPRRSITAIRPVPLSKPRPLVRHVHGRRSRHTEARPVLRSKGDIQCESWC